MNRIDEKSSKLYKSIAEIHITTTDIEDSKISVKKLDDYYNSLDTLLKKYEKDKKK